MLSFIVPSYNEEYELPKTLAAIRTAAQAAAQPYEVIVVDDDSTDATGDIAQRAGAIVVPVHCRQIAAARNAGARAAQGDVLFFVDADTRIAPTHVSGGQALLASGCSGGGARVTTDETIPLWGKLFMQVFCTLYYAANLGAGAFLFTTRTNFELAGGFDETFFACEEVYFTLALKRLGRFKLLREPILTSGRKLRMYSARHFMAGLFLLVFGGKRFVRSREKLDIWYGGKRERLDG